MASKTVIIAAIKDSEKWINITSNDDVEYGIYKEKCPKLVAAMAGKKAGDEITGNLSTKENKNFLWDIDEKKSSSFGGKSFTPADKGFDASKVAAQAACQLFSLEKDKDITKILAVAESLHAFMMSKITKPTTEAK